MLLVLGTGLFVLLTLRLLERAFLGSRRVWSPWIAVAVCRLILRLLGLKVAREGSPMKRPGSIVANHSSWLDVLCLNEARPLVFVSKAEIAGWHGIGWLARATGTIFVRREAPRETAAQVAAIRARMEGGETVVLFPEGTSSDGRRVLPFKPALLAASLPNGSVQPVTLSWRAPEGADPRFYAWFGGMGFGPHARAVLAARRQGGVTVTWHPPLAVAGLDRKQLARSVEDTIRGSLR